MDKEHLEPGVKKAKDSLKHIEQPEGKTQLDLSFNNGSEDE